MILSVIVSGVLRLGRLRTCIISVGAVMAMSTAGVRKSSCGRLKIMFGFGMKSHTYVLHKVHEKFALYASEGRIVHLPKGYKLN